MFTQIKGAPETLEIESAIVTNDFSAPEKNFRWRRYLRLHSAFSTVEEALFSLSFSFFFIFFSLF